MYDEHIRTALAQLLVGRAPGGRAYWRAAPANTPRPYVIVQLQSDALADSRVGRSGADVLVLIKVIADTLPEAEQVRDALCPLDTYGFPSLPALSVPDHSVTTRFDRTPALPYDGSAWQAGYIFRLSLLHV